MGIRRKFKNTNLGIYISIKRPRRNHGDHISHIYLSFHSANVRTVVDIEFMLASDFLATPIGIYEKHYLPTLKEHNQRCETEMNKT